MSGVAGLIGTVGEVVDGLLVEGPGGDVPTVGLVPGGTTNVLACTLGQPQSVVRSAKLGGTALRHDSAAARPGAPSR